jgi:hypothetical protein
MNNIKTKDIQKWIFDHQLLIYGILLILILVIPFLNNPVQSWDSQGHLINATFIKDHTWPEVVSWNPVFFFGYMQNQFYPPLFYFLVSTVGMVIPIELAFKLIILLGYFVFFVSAHKFTRTLGFTSKKSILFSTILLIFFSIVDINIQGVGCLGSTFYSSFICGLSPSILSMGFIFSSLYFIQKNINSKLTKPKYWKCLPGIFIALSVLTHFTGLVIFILIGGYLINFRKRSKIRTFLIKNVFIGFLLSSFWIIPFIFRLSMSERTNIFPKNDLALFIFCFIFLIGYYFIKKEKKIKTKMISIYLGGALLFVTLAIFPLFIESQIFRLIIPFYIVTILVTLSWINEKHILKFERFAGVIFLIILIVLLINFPQPDNIIEFGDLKKSDAYLLQIGTTQNYTAHHLISFYNSYNSNVFSTNGLFVEGTKSSIYSFTLQNNISKSLWWGIKKLQKNTDTNTIDNQLNLLGVNYIVVPSDANFSQKSFKLVEENFYTQYVKKALFNYSNNLIINYNLYKNKTPLKVVEPLKYNTKSISAPSLKHWFNINKINFFYFKNTIFVQSDKNFNKVDENIFISDISWSDNYQSFSFDINSKKEIPVFVRVSYYPTWKAYSDGKEIPIYWASPNFMLIEGKGTIEFKQTKLIDDYVGLILSYLGIIILLCSLLNWKKLTSKLKQI